MPLKPVTITLPSEILDEIDRRNNGMVTRSASLQKAFYQLISSEDTFNSLFPKQESSYKKYFEENVLPKLEEEAKKREQPPIPTSPYKVESSDTSFTVTEPVIQ